MTQLTPHRTLQQTNRAAGRERLQKGGQDVYAAVQSHGRSFSATIDCGSRSKTSPRLHVLCSAPCSCAGTRQYRSFPSSLSKVSKSITFHVRKRVNGFNIQRTMCVCVQVGGRRSSGRGCQRALFHPYAAGGSGAPVAERLNKASLRTWLIRPLWASRETFVLRGFRSGQRRRGGTEPEYSISMGRRGPSSTARTIHAPVIGDFCEWRIALTLLDPCHDALHAGAASTGASRAALTRC